MKLQRPLNSEKEKKITINCKTFEEVGINSKTWEKRENGNKWKKR